ncbi:MAG: AAA family ATPase [Ruminococcus sp.]|nr:AAA family ATPase [Candidatus Copronaster equi]
MKKYGLLGKKLSHSISPRIHSEFGAYAYELFCCEENELDSFFCNEKIDGFNVTIPYKKEAFKRCDFLSEIAGKTGSVNTVVRKNGKLYGYNTDVFGFEFSAKKNGLIFENKKVLILGNGGATLSVKYVAEKNNAKEIVIISRSGENNYENIGRHSDAQIIINATPFGMYPDNGGKLIDLSQFNNVEFVYDLIYNPLKTQLLIDAEKLNIPNCNGLMMLVSQAFKTAEIFEEKSFDFSLNDRIYKQILNERKNIVIIGMPGCGKTTIGKILAEKLNRNFIDTDEEIIKNCGRKIPEIFEEKGEEFFRNIETEIIKKAGKLFGKIIATGGGSILREENRNALVQNSVVVLLKRDLSETNLSGRPLLKNKNDVGKLYNERKNIYENFAEITVENKDIDSTVRRIIECVFL